MLRFNYIIALPVTEAFVFSLVAIRTFPLLVLLACSKVRRNEFTRRLRFYFFLFA